MSTAREFRSASFSGRLSHGRNLLRDWLKLCLIDKRSSRLAAAANRHQEDINCTAVSRRIDKPLIEYYPNAIEQRLTPSVLEDATTQPPTIRLENEEQRSVQRQEKEVTQFENICWNRDTLYMTSCLFRVCSNTQSVEAQDWCC